MIFVSSQYVSIVVLGHFDWLVCALKLALLNQARVRIQDRPINARELSQDAPLYDIVVQ
jgi:hypothetical protein